MAQITKRMAKSEPSTACCSWISIPIITMRSIIVDRDVVVSSPLGQLSAAISAADTCSRSVVRNLPKAALP
jgi:hypothetical protein